MKLFYIKSSNTNGPFCSPSQDAHTHPRKICFHRHSAIQKLSRSTSKRPCLKKLAGYIHKGLETYACEQWQQTVSKLQKKQSRLKLCLANLHEQILNASFSNHTCANDAGFQAQAASQKSYYQAYWKQLKDLELEYHHLTTQAIHSPCTHSHKSGIRVYDQTQQKCIGFREAQSYLKQLQRIYFSGKRG